jgi:hypothetical protein
LNVVSSLLYNPPHLHKNHPLFSIKQAILYSNWSEFEVFYPQTSKTVRREIFSTKINENGAE